MVRRILPRPRPLITGPADLARRGGEQLLRAASTPGIPAIGSDHLQVHGPHLLSGGWWCRERRRAYHFLEADNGKVLWVFFDEVEKRWYLHGVVE